MRTMKNKVTMAALKYGHCWECSNVEPNFVDNDIIDITITFKHKFGSTNVILHKKNNTIVDYSFDNNITLLFSVAVDSEVITKEYYDKRFSYQRYADCVMMYNLLMNTFMINEQL